MAKETPNIIFIMADDMGYGDLGCNNPDSKIPTPHMDQLAAEGMRFTDAHSPSAVCTPTRYGVMTGRYCWRSRLKQGVCGGYETPLIETDRMTLASMLKTKGYHTACIGKWHIGATFHDKDGNPTEAEEEVDFNQPVAGGPADLGFDYSFYNAGCGTCAPPYGFIENRRCLGESWHHFNPGSDGPIGLGAWGQWHGMMAEGWVTKDADPIITDKACTYIRERAESEAPFFLYLTPNAPHEPCLEQFVPDFARGKSEAGPRGDLVWLFDWTVGQVMETLKATGQAENTLVIVTSDNGALAGDFVLDEEGQRLYAEGGNNDFLYNTHDHKSNGDWRGYKAHIWEGGHRMPYVAHWPGTIPAGTTSDELICLTDTMATLAAITGCDLPDNAGEDSFDALPAFLGTQEGSVRDAVIHHSSFGVFSIRKDQWKMIFECQDSGGWPTPRGSKPEPGLPGQLYDILADPGEETNLWEERSDVVAELTELLNQIRKSDRSAPK